MNPCPYYCGCRSCESLPLLRLQSTHHTIVCSSSTGYARIPAEHPKPGLELSTPRVISRSGNLHFLPRGVCVRVPSFLYPRFCAPCLVCNLRRHSNSLPRLLHVAIFNPTSALCECGGDDNLRTHLPGAHRRAATNRVGLCWRTSMYVTPHRQRLPH